MIYTQLNCDHDDKGYFRQVPGTVFKSEKNWIAMLIFHYMRYHVGYVPQDIVDDASKAVDAEVARERQEKRQIDKKLLD